MRLRAKLALVFTFLSLLIVGGLGYIAYNAGERAIQQNVSDQLLDMNLLKEAEIERWIVSNERSLAALSQCPLVREYSASLISNDLSDLELIDIRTRLVTDHLLPALRAAGGFLSLSLLHPTDGRVLLSTDATLEGKYKENRTFFVQGRSGTYTGNAIYELTAAEVVMHVSTPILDISGDLVGVLVAHADLAEMATITMRRSEFAIEEDTYLVNKFNFFVTEPAYGEGYALHRAVYTEGVTLALEGGTGVAFYDDYRGTPVLGAYRWIEERDLAIITEIPVNDAFAPVVRLRNSIAGVGVAAALISVLLSFLFAQRITKRLQELSGGIEEVAGGDLSIRIESLARDEVGSLGRSFNKMAERLETTTTSRDELANEITQRVQAEETLQEAEAELRHTIEVVPGIIAKANAQTGYFTDCNPALSDILGFSAEEFLARPFIEFVHPDDRQNTIDEVERQLQGSPVDRFENRYICKDGSYKWLEWRATAAGEKGVVYAAATDITERKQAEEAVQKSLSGTIQAIGQTTEMRDPYTAGHQRRVTQLACAIAEEMNLPQDQIEGIRVAGVMHDIGKMSIPAEILSKPSELTDTEFSLIKDHSQAAYEILKSIQFPWPIAQIVLQHHERMDGSGYPHSIKNAEIMLEARILGVADVVDAMASHRPYRPALGIDNALDEISKNKDVRYDSEVVDACVMLFRQKGFAFSEQGNV